MTRLRSLVVGTALALAASLALAAATTDKVRFSATLTEKQRVESGLGHLSTDNVAVIDGLVRQDEAASRFKNNEIDHTRFSQRRTARERELAGLAHLTPAQLEFLDGLVLREIAGPEPDPVSATNITSGVASGNAGVSIITRVRPPEIHGSISYTYGRSNAGSFQGGDVVLTYDDPARRFSLLFAYSEYRGKGLPFCYYPLGVPYDRFDAIPLAPR